MITVCEKKDFVKHVIWNSHNQNVQIVSIASDPHRKALTSFRLVSHNLEIERGRHDNSL